MCKKYLLYMINILVSIQYHQNTIYIRIHGKNFTFLWCVYLMLQDYNFTFLLSHIFFVSKIALKIAKDRIFETLKQTFYTRG